MALSTDRINNYNWLFIINHFLLYSVDWSVDGPTDWSNDQSTDRLKDPPITDYRTKWLIIKSQNHYYLCDPMKAPPKSTVALFRIIVSTRSSTGIHPRIDVSVCEFTHLLAFEGQGNFIRTLYLCGRHLSSPKVLEMRCIKAGVNCVVNRPSVSEVCCRFYDL